MKDFIKKCINNEIKLERYQLIGIICLIIVLSGTFGWIYEFIFYYFDQGKFYYKGGNFMPWINIYATGSLMIMFLTRKVKKKPFLVFLIAFISTGILEYISGYVIFKMFNGLRFWDYNKEILNFGNIGGFVCLRSVLFFGLSGLLLIYLMVPFCIWLSQKLNKRLFLIISITLCSIILFDEFYNLIFARILKLPRACDIYKKLGVNYMGSYK